MKDDLKRALLRLKLTIASHISNINIRHENLEGRYINLVKEVDKLEDRIRDLEKDVNTVVFKAVKNTLLIMGSIVSTFYGLLKLVEFMVG